MYISAGAAILAHASELNRSANTSGTPPSDIRRMLSDSMFRNSRGIEAAQRLAAASNPGSRNANEHRVTYSLNVHERMMYSVSNHKTKRSAALVDRGANGCVIGQDCRPIPDCPKTHCSVDVGGIDGHQKFAGKQVFRKKGTRFNQESF